MKYVSFSLGFLYLSIRNYDNTIWLRNKVRMVIVFPVTACIYWFDKEINLNKDRRAELTLKNIPLLRGFYKIQRTQIFKI